jgi:ABC-type multidrug transport system permease subunit
MISTKEKGQVEYYLYQMMIKALKNSLIMLLIFGNNLMNFILFWFVIANFDIEKLLAVFNLFSIEVSF